MRVLTREKPFDENEPYKGMSGKTRKESVVTKAAYKKRKKEEKKSKHLICVFCMT